MQLNISISASSSFDFSKPDIVEKDYAIKSTVTGSSIRTTKIEDTTLSYSLYDDRIHLLSMKTPATKRRKGSARQAMALFLKEADRLGMAVTLEASPLDKKTSLQKLVEFYQSFGFKLTGKRVNFAGDPEMKRYPIR